MTRRSGIMLCYPFEISRLEGPSRKAWNSFPVFVQPKLDGLRCRCVWVDGAPVLLSSEENIILTVPHITKYLYEQREFFEGVELDGELYSHRLPFEEIISRVNRDTIHPHHTDIQFHVFDVVTEDAQRDRLDWLVKMRLHTADAEAVRVVRGMYASSLEEVENLLNHYYMDGYEGIIVRRLTGMYERKRSTSLMKFKPTKTDTYEIVGVEQLQDKHGNYREELGALILTDPEGNIFNVGTGFTQHQRRHLWETRELLPGKHCTIKYQALTEKKIPRFSVFVEVVNDKPTNK